MCIRDRCSLSTSEEGGSSTYVETDFSRYEALDGVEIATRVLVNDNVKLRVANKMPCLQNIPDR